MDNFKSGFVSIIGRTNVGKSTLTNSLVGEKVAITADKRQTTRTAIRAIVNRENSQIIFIDTPGIHKPKTKLGQTMNETAWGTIPDVDVLLFLVEATSDKIGKGDTMVLEKIREKSKKTILVINKIDLIEKEKLLKLIDMYSKEYNFEAVIPISALKNENTKRVSYQDRDFTITRLVTQTGKRSSYYAVSATDYTIKLLSSISPAYEETIDDLMLSHGADTVSIITKPFWIVQFPYVYMKKYIKTRCQEKSVMLLFLR